ncbi:MAG TPA: cyclic nucleotide-binding domain-containing protein [Burkholderiales bacterium]
MRRPIRAEAFLGQLPLFAGLSAEVLTRLAAATTRRELRRGEILFREGDVPSGFYIVVHGRVALTAGAKNARNAWRRSSAPAAASASRSCFSRNPISSARAR